MGTTTERRPLGWIWLLYGPLWGGLRLLYTAVNRANGNEALGNGIPNSWWVLAFFYFAADLMLVLGIKLFLRRRTASENPPGKSFWYEVMEIVPIWFLLHLVLLFFEYPVSKRLEDVGLGKLEVIAFIAFVAVVAGDFCRSIRIKEGPILDQG